MNRDNLYKASQLEQRLTLLEGRKGITEALISVEGTLFYQGFSSDNFKLVCNMLDIENGELAAAIKGVLLAKIEIKIAQYRATLEGMGVAL